MTANQSPRRANLSRITRRTLAVETLQPRWTPVVGAFSVPTALDWSRYDGIVQVNTTYSDGTRTIGSGTLLSSGQHILTAAHVVTQESGARLTAVTIDFKMKENASAPQQIEKYVISNPSASVNVHPSWDGLDDDDYNHDLAVIRLDTLAPIDADRFQLRHDAPRRIAISTKQGG